MHTWWALLRGKTLQMPAGAWKSFDLLNETQGSERVIVRAFVGLLRL